MSWFWSNIDSIWQLALAHVALSVPPIVIAFLLSIPIGWVANRYRASRGLLLTIGGILYTIPSLPLFIAMPSLIGTKILDPVNVVVALSIYGLALMVRTTADALASVDGAVLGSATAIGFSAFGRFFAVDLPLAGPVLLAGLRVVSVSTVSLVSVSSIVGVSSLGNLFLDGYQRSFTAEILVGIVGTLIIAFIFDALLVILGRILMPWTRKLPGGRKRAARVTAETVTAS